MSVLPVFAEHERLFTSVQIQMLHALLGDDATSDRALRAWVAKVNIDDIDNSSYRLIPALFSRAGLRPVIQPLHGRMKGIYRYFFYRNNRFLARMERVFSALISAEIDFVIFKGTSIAIQYHDSAAVRSSADCDVLVHPRDKERAEAVLADCGFVYRYDAQRKPQDQHSHDFIDRVENGCDLHWYALAESCEEDIDGGFWSRSRHITWRGLELRVLAAEDELLVAGINGIREIENARADWLYDASTIFRSTPNFDWRLLHEELIRRNLQERFLTAFGQFHRFIPDFPAALVERTFSGEIRTAARQLVAENRTFALDPIAGRKLKAFLAPPGVFQRFVGAIRKTDWQALIADSHDVVRHMRYDTHEDGSISNIYLRRDAEAFLGDVFDIADPEALRKAHNFARRLGEVEFRLPPGVLRIPQHISSRRHAATLQSDGRSLRFPTPDITSVTIKVRVTNNSTWPWCVFAGDQRQFAVSYHLFGEFGEPLIWDFPRRYFPLARPGQVAMLLPGDGLDLEVEILRPPAPGRYEVRLDIVHEHVAWFDAEVQRFPRLPAEVA
jgi:hypothetical protein